MKKLLKTHFYTVFTIFLFSFFAFLFGRPYISGDGWGYYAAYDIFVKEGKFTTKTPEKYTKYASWTLSKVPEKGEYAPTYTPGASIAWSPFITVFRVIDNIPQVKNINSMILDGKGHTLGTGLGVLVGTMFYSFIALMLTFKLLSNFFSKRISYISTLTLFFVTYLFNYTFFEPSYVHAISTCFLTIALYLMYKYFNSMPKTNYLVLSGAALALGAIVRVEILVATGVIFLLLLIYKRKEFVISLLSFALVYSINFIYSYLAYGSPLKTGFSVSCSSCKLFAPEYFSLDLILMDPVRGLLSWSPLIIFSIIGLILAVKNKKLFKYSIFSGFVVVATILFYSFWNNWWAGGSVGQRFFISLLPFFAFGLAFVIEKMKTQSDNLTQRRIINISIGMLCFFSGLFSVLISRSYYTYPREDLDIHVEKKVTRLYPKDSEQYTVYNYSRVSGNLLNPITLIFENYHDYRDTLPVILKKLI